MTQNTQRSKALELKISTVVAAVVVLYQSDLDQIEAELTKITAGSDDYFDNELAVVDVAALHQDEFSTVLDWVALKNLLAKFSIRLVAVRHASELHHQAIVEAGLCIDQVARVKSEAESEPKQVALEIAQAPVVTQAAPVEVTERIVYEHLPAMIIDQPVRGGQRVYARGADLIVTAVVNSGAEVIADGSIHVYAPLRGRALAGATGNTSARIFALAMEPELVSIAGIYRTFENGFPLDKAQAAQVRLSGDKLEVNPV